MKTAPDGGRAAWSLVALVSSTGLAACLATSESGPTLEPEREAQGMKIVNEGYGSTAVQGAVQGAVAALPTCVEAVSGNPAFQCLWQGFVQGGGVGAMRDAALACGCAAEIVVSGTQPAACNVQRVAVYCSGDPPFSAVSPIPNGEYPCPGVDLNENGKDDDVLVVSETEPPFIGIHIDPENAGRLCDVSIEPNGPFDRVEKERCTGCHKDNGTRWEPAVVQMAPIIE